MKGTTLWAGVLVLFSSIGLGQQANQQPDPAVPDNAVGRQLILWSEVQRPQPIPQVSSRVNPEPLAIQQYEQPTASEQASVRAFTGTVIKNVDKYVLELADSSAVFQIDDQEKARQFEGKQVRVAGSLALETKMLYVASIEMLS